MKTIDRNTYDSYEMLIELVSQLVKYFKETKNENLYIDTYKFCNHIISDDGYSYGSVVDDKLPWKNRIWYNDIALNEEEIYDLLAKFDFVKNQPKLSAKQISIINYVLKNYYVNSGLFFNENGEINANKKVELPNTDIITSVEEIRETRKVLKKLRKALLSEAT